MNMNKIRKSTIIFVSLLFLSTIVFGVALGWGLSETKNVINSEYITSFDTALPTKLLDINGELITEFASDEKREIISLNMLPQHMIDALITREDRIFYSHHGFSIKAILRAVVGKLTGRSLGGGSTLTQQIAGTLYCDRTEMSITRKIKELWWAIQMERRYSKDEILELYLNKIYFGGGTYGVNAASKYYFGHSATEITPAEAAILVIQLSNPAFYNPFDYPNRAMERQRDVLNSMVQEGFLTKEVADESFDEFWSNFDYTRTSSSAYLMRDDKAPWFSEYVRRELGNLIYGSESIYTSGFTVNTTLNLALFSLMCGMDNLKVSIVNRANQKIKLQNEKTTIEGTMVSLENETGYINALVGGSKFDQENQFIRAVQSKIQPGSTFKPLYYTEAIDSRKFNPSTLISDTPVVFHTADGTPYIPQNFKGEWEGNVQLWYALVRSMNIPSLKVLDGIGFDAAISRAISLLGIPDEEVSSRGFVPGYPIGLGVCSVRPIEMARAFSVIASGGKEITPMAIRTVEDKNGNVILNPEKEIRQAQQAKGENIQVISPQTAFVMAKLLEQTVNNGGTLAAQSWKFEYKTEDGKKYTMPAGGKTGTTQNWADAWTVGFTPYYTSAFWFGFDKPGQSLGLHITGATLAGFAWGDYMRAINRDLIPKDFPQPPSGVIQATVCSTSGQILTPECGSHQTTQWFLAGTQPTTVCSLHSNKTGTTLGISRLQTEMYQSGYHLTERIDTTPLKLNLSFLNKTDLDSIQEEELQAEETKEVENQEFPEYNYLME